jgi:predicted double-glycine peptidase
MLRWAARFCCIGVCGVLLAAGAPGVLLDVPFIKQEKDGCGAAALAMVMQYWQIKQGRPATASADDILQALYSRRGRGIYASDMEQYLREHGFPAFALRGEWSDLEHHLEKGRPLIVALKITRDDMHYVVVTGMDHDVVLKHDPADRKLRMQHRSEFEREWKGSGNWTLLAVPAP